MWWNQLNNAASSTWLGKDFSRDHRSDTTDPTMSHVVKETDDDYSEHNRAMIIAPLKSGSYDSYSTSFKCRIVDHFRGHIGARQVFSNKVAQTVLFESARRSNSSSSSNPPNCMVCFSCPMTVARTFWLFYPTAFWLEPVSSLAP